MTTTTGNFADLLWPGLADLWGHEYERWAPIWSQLFTIKESNKAYEKELGVTRLGLAAIKEQGAPSLFTDPMQGFPKEYVNATYALGAVVTREMSEDDQYNYINSIPGMLSDSMSQTLETVNTNHFNNGYTAGFTGADGVILFSGSHNLAGGGTYSNILATASDLTQTALEQAFIDISNYVDDMGLRMNLKPMKLLVPTALQFTARKIMETEKIVDSADNTKNVIAGSLSVVVSPYLTDSDQWQIITNAKNGMTHYWRRQPQAERDNEFSTQNLQMLTTMRFASGWTDPHGVYGSPGA